MNQSGLSQARLDQSLHASPTALDRAGTQLDAIVEALRRAIATAADGFATAGAGAATGATADGWTSTQAMQHVLTASSATLSAVADVAERTAAGLHASARAYLRTDERAAAW